MLEVKNSLITAIENYKLPEKISPFKMKFILEGMKAQVEQSHTSAKEVLSQAIHESPLWDEIKEKLVTCENLLFFPDKMKWLEELTTYKENNLEKSKQLLEILGDSVTLVPQEKIVDERALLKDSDSLNKSKELKEVSNLKDHSKEEEGLDIPGKKQKFKEFQESLSENSSLIPKALAKLNRLKAKNDFQKSEVQSNTIQDLIERTYNLISKKFISNEIEKSNSDEYIARVDKYKKLKEAWQEAFKSIVTLSEDININLYKLEIVPQIKQFQNKLDLYLKNFNDFKKHCKKFHCSTLAADFKPDYDSKIHETHESVMLEKEPLEQNVVVSLNRFKHDFSKLLEEAQRYKALKETCLERRFSFAQERASLSEQVSNQLLNISKNIKELEEKQIELLPTEGELKSLVNDSHTNSIIQLRKLRDEIENAWNKCCFDLFEIRDQIYLSQQFNEPNEKLSLCYFLAQCIFENSRQIRKTEKPVETHFDLLKDSLYDHLLLVNLIGQKWDPLHDQQGVLTLNMQAKSNNQFNELLGYFNKQLSFMMCNEYAAIKSHNFPELAITDIMLTNDGFVWNDETKKNQIYEQIKQMRKKIENEYENQKLNFQNGFKTHLFNICKEVAYEINFVMNTLKWYGNDPDWIYRFNEAYPVKNTLGNFATKGGTSLKLVGKVVGNAIYNAIVTKDEPVEEDEFQNPVDSSEEEDQRFIPVKSPFETMKMNF
jgi:hypothetical protein